MSTIIIIHFIITMKFKKLILTTLFVSPIYSTIAQSNGSELDSIVVSAKAPVSENEFAGSASSMTFEDIERLGISSVSEAIETLPGVQLVVSGGSSTKVPQVRGFDSDQVLVLINGKRIANTDRNIPFSPGYRYDWIPIANIEKIEILKGSTSSLYGADAMGGVINIITKTPNKDFSFNLNAGAEQLDSEVSGGNTNQIGASFSGFISDNVDYLIAAEKTDTDALVSEDGSTAVSGRDRANLELDLGIDVNDTSRASISLIDSQEELIDGDISAFTGQLSTTTTDISRNSIGINYETVFGNYDSNFGISSSKAEQDGSSQWNVEETTITADFQGQLSLNQYLSFGILHRNEGVDRNDSVVFSDETDATMAYVQDVITLNSKNNLTLGLAADSHSKYGTEPSPKIYFNHKFSDAIGFKIGAGRSYLAPALRESSSAYRVPAGPTRVYIGMIARGYFGIGVEGISKPMNFGNLSRSAQGFGASFVFTVSPAKTIKKPGSDTARSWDHWSASSVF